MEPVTVLINAWSGCALRVIRRSTASILAQTLQPAELLVVADGPLKAEVDEFLESLQGETSIPVRIVRVVQQTGLWNGRNVGLRESKTELVALQDTDDVMHPQRLEIQISEMSSRQIDVLGSDAFEFEDQSGVIVGCRQSPHNQDQLIKRLLLNNPFNHSTVMLRRSSVLECGGYRNMYLLEDYDLWLRMASEGYTLAIGKKVSEALSVDLRLLDRRGGWHFVKNELVIGKLIRDKFGYSLFRQVIRMVMRLVYRVAPKFVRRFGQRFFLRRPVGENTPRNLEEFLLSNLLTT